MLKDLEGNVITLSEKPNGHLLVLGRSGAGKTYFSCRKVEEEMEKGSRIFVFDYSCSYSVLELEKNRFQHTDKAYILNPMEAHMDWKFSGKSLPHSLVNALLKGLKIGSYYQKRLLREAIEGVLENGGAFSIPQLIEQLENLYDEKEDPESLKNIVHLLNRMEPYGGISEITISPKVQETTEGPQCSLTIVQFSDYSEMQRNFLVELFAGLFWEEARHGEKKADIILFDEFQNMNLRPGSALSSMLREGRKFGMSVWLSSQFLGNYGKDAVDTLMQAGNTIFFKPTERDMKSIASMIDPNFAKKWQNALNRLKVGEAVIKGNYRINGNKKEISTPLLCKIQEVKNI